MTASHSLIVEATNGVDVIFRNIRTDNDNHFYKLHRTTDQQFNNYIEELNARKHKLENELVDYIRNKFHDVHRMYTTDMLRLSSSFFRYTLASALSCRHHACGILYALRPWLP